MHVGVGASSDLGQPFLQDIGAEGALLPSTIVRVRVKKNWAIGFAMFFLGELIAKWKYVRFEILFLR